jgi:hypothetical protein
VQRAPSRLYRATAASSREINPHSKYCCPNTCIGPEFIVRATKPCKEIRIKGVKVNLSWKIHVNRELKVIYRVLIYAGNVNLLGKNINFIKENKEIMLILFKSVK